MAFRDLTQNRPGYSSEDRLDPFEDGSYESSTGTSTENLLHNGIGDSPPMMAGQDELNPTPPPHGSNIMAPTEFDRYPLMVSRDVSSTSLASHFRNSALTKSSSSSSNRVVDPFAAGMDVSPFGGYPASQFPLHIDEKEEDDHLHNPDPLADAEYDKNRFLYDIKHMDRRSLYGLAGFVLLFLAAISVFVILPVLTYSGITNHYTPEHYEILTDYDYPLSSAIRTSLIDPDTPKDALKRKVESGDEWVLTFSDEFNAEGRTFYDGDDQFFQAVDIHYDATKDLEWYDPDAVTTENGTLVLRLDAYKNHNLFYRSGMVQSWNRLCFTQGLIVTTANLPNYGNVSGLWPGLWTMGNIGRPGYLATTDGVWPYTYDSCDAGITANQSSPDGISYLPGQRLNKCTCAGEDHPNTGTGRGAPEIDILEGAVDTVVKVGTVSQSFQVAPMDIWYMPDYNFIEIHNKEVTTMNTYCGGPFQQAVSGVSTLNNTWYEAGAGAGNFQEFGFEYLNDNDSGYITWLVGRQPTFTVHSYALGPNGNVGFRRISKEPMSIIMNLGVSNSWAYIDWASINFPSHMRVDSIRIYQPPDEINMTCDPEDYPTYNYIEDHLDAYMNPNKTSWTMAGYKIPRNKIVHNC